MSEAAVHVSTEAERAGGEVRLLLTVMEAAQRLGIGRSLMYELLASGSIPSIRVGRLRRVPCQALTEFIDERRGGGRQTNAQEPRQAGRGEPALTRSQ